MGGDPQINPQAHRESVKPLFNEMQIALTLSVTPYMVTRFTGDVRKIESEALKAMRRFLRLPRVVQLLGEWDVVWGPACHMTALSTVADNTMFVLSSTREPNSFYICICGTNPLSLYSWLFQNFNPGLTIWPYGEGAGLISRGALGGMASLVTLTSCGRGAHRGSGPCTLREFLRLHAAQQDSAPAAGQSQAFKMVVAGHSLGGALAPALALYLRDTEHEWNPGGSVVINTLSAASPTIGDAQFAKYLDSRLAPGLVCLRNYYDVVTHGWKRELLSQLPTLYEPGISCSTSFRVAASIWLSLTRGSLKHEHIGADQQWLFGKRPNGNRSFFAEMAYQHVPAYFEILECSEILEILAPFVTAFAEILVSAPTVSFFQTLRASLDQC